MDYEGQGDLMKGGFSICFAASKGGVAKTTLTVTFAVRAAQEAERVAILDLDPQHSTARWWELRGKPSNPRLFTGVENVTDDIELLKSRGWQWIIMDTPGWGALNILEPAVVAADLTIIPCSASAVELEAIHAIVDLCRKRRRPYVFLLNRIDPASKMNASATAYLESMGKVLGAQVSKREAYISSFGVGKTGPETQAKAAAKICAQEVDAAWKEIRRVASGLAKK